MPREIVQVFGVDEMQLSKIKPKKVEKEFRRLHPELCKEADIGKSIAAYYRKMFYRDEAPERYGIICELLAERLQMEGCDIKIASDGDRILLGFPPHYAWAMPPEMTVLSEQDVRKAFANVFIALGGGLPTVEYHVMEISC